MPYATCVDVSTFIFDYAGQILKLCTGNNYILRASFKISSIQHSP